MKSVSAYLSKEILKRFGTRIEGEPERLNTAWRQGAGEALAEHSRPARYSGGRLTVHVDSAAWASKIRHQQGRLLTQLQLLPFFAALTEIRVRIKPAEAVLPGTGVPAPGPSRRQMPDAVSSLILGVAADVKDPELRAALQKLGGRGRNKPASKS